MKDTAKYEVTLPKQLRDKLETTVENTGLSKAEITRRGIYREIQSLQDLR